MAMNVGSPGRSNDMDVMIDINTTPLIDVMLVLLVMLIITIPIQLHSVNLNLPTGNPPPPLVLPEVVKLDIDDQSRVYWNGDVVEDHATLEAKMAAAARQQVHHAEVAEPAPHFVGEAAVVFEHRPYVRGRRVGVEP